MIPTSVVYDTVVHDAWYINIIHSFVTLDVFRMVFRGGTFGGGCYNCPEPYLNGTIVLFDYDMLYISSLHDK